MGIGPDDYAAIYDGRLDDVVLAYQRAFPQRAVLSGPIKFTVRQRICIRRNRLNQRVQQWIHDHLPEARCDC